MQSLSCLFASLRLCAFAFKSPDRSTSLLLRLVALGGVGALHLGDGALRAGGLLGLGALPRASLDGLVRPLLLRCLTRHRALVGLVARHAVLGGLDVPARAL